MEKDVADSWRRLELALACIVKKLIKHSGVHLELDFNWLPLPSTRGYLHPHRFYEKAIKCIYRSRDAFLGLLATISLGAVLFERSTSVPDMSSPWINYLASHEGIDRVWVEDLARTFVGDFSNKISRLGTFIEVGKFSSFEVLRELLKVNVPIWFHWCKVGRAPPRTGWDIIDKHAPPTTVVDEIIRNYSRLRTSFAQSHHSHVPTTLSRQVNETFTQFFDRQHSRHAFIEKNEDEETKTRRLARERLAMAYLDEPNVSMIPGSGTKVYAWIKFISGSRIRTLLNGGELKWRWKMYTPAAKRYNSHDDEWDLCSEFDDDYRYQKDSVHGQLDMDDEISDFEEPFEEDFNPLMVQEDYELALEYFGNMLQSLRSTAIPLS
ncbi:hypothetical protein M422DRAFT_271597 [Sphaerobolus stellatus SS14]|uniref:Uncharacterized protein n=1 Tax=Sphaerobolus stellatus (strain SS14) TaxID=990650 RepID=A0A0C9TDB9_SPHS4|nr:hypothetical protein M422DRAFT_271597 [Sphaerobolus stellatus SS14]